MEQEMFLHDQSVGAIMMALQKSLLEQSDITPVLMDFNFEVGEDEALIVRNPPKFQIGKDTFHPEVKSTVGSD